MGHATIAGGTTRRRAGLFCALALIAAWPAPGAAQTETRLVLGTATPGGGFPAWGEALAASVGEVEPGLVLETRATGGSAENLGLLREGRLDLALVQGEFAYAALATEGAAGLSVVAPVYATPGLFVVPAASPVRGIADLRGRPVALGTRDSGLTVLARAVLLASNLDPERDIVPILLDRAGDGPDLIGDGRAAALWGAGLGWPGFLRLARAPGGARFLGPSPEAVARLVAERPSLRRLTVPAGSFPGQAAPIETVGSWSFVLARPGLDAGVVERLVRAIGTARERLAARQAQGGESDPRNLADAVPAAWLHPGTARHLRAVGAR